jgi:hypothetical protein
MKSKVFVFLFLSLVTFLQAQISQPARWEQENKYADDTYSVISLSKDGVALIRELDEYRNGNRVWQLVILDTALQERWTNEVELKDELRFTGYEYTPGKLNLMFRRNESDILRAEILMVDLGSQLIQFSKTEVKLQIRLTHYTVVDGSSVFGGYVINEPVLIIFDPIKESNLIVPGFFMTDTELLDVRPNKNNTFNILLSQRTQGKKKLIFRTIDKLGNILIEDEMNIEDEKTILGGVVSVLQHDEVMIAGTFTYNNSKLASGIFSSLIDPFTEQRIQYVEFHQFQHFLDYLPEKKASKIREKAINRGSRPPEFKTHVGAHRIEEFEGGFAFFGESYILSSGSSNPYSSPAYNPSARAYGSPYSFTPFSNRYYNNPYQYPAILSSEELRMIEGFVIGFDFKGRRLWDYSIPMDDYKSQGREQVSDFTVYKGIPHFLFKNENELKFSNHSTDTLKVNEAITLPIKLKSEYEESKSSDEELGNVRHWYDNYFYVWGVQTVKDIRREEHIPSRRVFYINKIQLD